MPLKGGKNYGCLIWVCGRSQIRQPFFYWILGGKTALSDGKTDLKSSATICRRRSFINYKKQGYEKVKSFLEQNFIDDILSVDKKIRTLNPKAILQEYTQGINKKLPEYILVKEEGKAHNKNFWVDVKFNDEIIGSGCAKSIKKAQSEAAKNALKKLDLIEE